MFTPNKVVRAAIYLFPRLRSVLNDRQEADALLTLLYTW